MDALKELIRLYQLTDNPKVKAWLAETFESAKCDELITCPDSEVKAVQNLRLE